MNMPPLGIMPKWLLDEKRLNAIVEAIYRCIEAAEPIREEWIKEYNELIKGDNKLCKNG